MHLYCSEKLLWFICIFSFLSFVPTYELSALMVQVISIVENTLVILDLKWYLIVDSYIIVFMIFRSAGVSLTFIFIMDLIKNSWLNSFDCLFNEENFQCSTLTVGFFFRSKWNFEFTDFFHWHTYRGKFYFQLNDRLMRKAVNIL